MIEFQLKQLNSAGIPSNLPPDAIKQFFKGMILMTEQCIAPLFNKVFLNNYSERAEFDENPQFVNFKSVMEAHYQDSKLSK